MQVFHGPWDVKHIMAFVNSKCSRSARIGRVYVADILATQFVNAPNYEEQVRVHEGFKSLHFAHVEGRMHLASQQYLRYYAEIMEVRFSC
jgi:hypothetical protein